MRAPLFLGCVLLPIALACGGGGGGGGSAFGSSAGPAATALCEHAATERECPCTPVAAGETIVVDGLEIQITAARRHVGLDKLPEIGNSTERATFSKLGNNALAVDVAFTNTKPVKHDVELAFLLISADGEEQGVAPYNAREYMKGKDGWLDLWNDASIGPSRTKSTGMVFPVAKGEEEGALLWIRKQEKKPDPMDPRGRLKTFTLEQVVMELPALQ